MDVRNKEIKVKVSSQEYTKIKNKAERIGLKPASFLRLLGLRVKLGVTIDP